MVQRKEIDLYPHVSAELTPTFKQKRTEALLQLVDESMETMPIMPALTPHTLRTNHPKEPPARRREHEKWKIVPKTIYDKTT